MHIGFGLRLNNIIIKRIEKNDSFKDFEDGKRIRIFLETERDIAPHTYALSLEQAKQLNKQLTEELALL
ncbi:hypothetical protein QLH32_15660 [Acinetobacter corruptisaponis]|uniref:Uncharacterized protein n=1 Tax=Acinetobacter corruptisaponis TaxID=3045147 RepID=A0ABY8S5A0_9GAMM|nr:hypothetical protein [Acinetobacter sp. KCTC 92772]WHP05429.1 hypothetical protein QLH32_15660 [Acinetobacter sp. KCTC 92772]